MHRQEDRRDKREDHDVEVSGNTLLRFYVLHIMVFPLVAAVFLAVHFWRIRKDGGISGPL